MSNAVAEIDHQIRENPKKVALWLPHRGSLIYSELDKLSRQASRSLLARGVNPGDRVLLFVDLSFDLYALILAAARLGLAIVLVEPWMPLNRIERVVRGQKPKVFVSGFLGRLWGARIQAVRDIPHKILASEIHHQAACDHGTEEVPPDHPCILTFTTGSTGEPKGMVRTHGYLKAQLSALNESLAFHECKGADICIFANFALANLANGRTSLVIPQAWRRKELLLLNHLSGALSPETITAGPSFMERLLRLGGPSSLRKIHVGGAPTDNALFERIFGRWPSARVTHVYGSTEAEPVAHIDAREAVSRSRAKGFFQTLCVGYPWGGLLALMESDQLWISGPHVSPEYLDNDSANIHYKRRDQEGRLWHRMGDRMVEEDGVWFFAGRERQARSDFDLEQRLYLGLGHSNAFLHRTHEDQLNVYVEAKGRDSALLPRSLVPEAKHVFFTRIIRDPRHRARIDRERSIRFARRC